MSHSLSRILKAIHKVKGNALIIVKRGEVESVHEITERDELAKENVKDKYNVETA